jgi:hypothetical protein
VVVDPGQARDDAGALMKLLSEFDPGSGDFVETHRDALRSLFSPDAWTSFEGQVQAYAFEEALAQLTQVLHDSDSKP